MVEPVAGAGQTVRTVNCSGTTQCGMTVAAKRFTMVRSVANHAMIPTMAEMIKRGPGWARMMSRLGPEKAEALRQQVLKEQDAARNAIVGERGSERDREWYRTYPAPKSKRRKK